MARYVRVSSISYGGLREDGPQRRRRSLERAMAMVDEAAHDRPDLIVLPEIFVDLGCGDWTAPEIAEGIPGPTFDAMAARARQHRTYLCGSLVRERDGCYYNTAVLVDREGELVGEYDKRNPTTTEMDRGITPGETIPVFDTDFGRVGMAICFDLNFWEVGHGLKEAGSELIVFTSMYRGGFQLRAWAYVLQQFIVSATPGENSAVVDPLGRVLAESSEYGRIITQRINLDAQVLHIDFNESGVRKAKEKYGNDLELVVHSPEAVYMLTSHHETVTVDDIIAEFGLERLDDYYDRSRQHRVRCLEASRVSSATTSGS